MPKLLKLKCLCFFHMITLDSADGDFCYKLTVKNAIGIFTRLGMTWQFDAEVRRLFQDK